MESGRAQAERRPESRHDLVVVCAGSQVMTTPRKRRKDPRLRRHMTADQEADFENWFALLYDASNASYRDIALW